MSMPPQAASSGKFRFALRWCSSPWPLAKSVLLFLLVDVGGDANRGRKGYLLLIFCYFHRPPLCVKPFKKAANRDETPLAFLARNRWNEFLPPTYRQIIGIKY
ncbi:MAG TPA: hypothetical protein PK971_04400 [Saprospiraceae bacterium]|nr:hypothetical protein [Saprospiraceae bacterium]HND87542.1 hypothetical protein [Saprospiraceae bacterium]